MTKMTVLVTGATGKQGGHVARLLLSKGHSVRALTRDATTAAARELARRGATIVTGDLVNRDSLERAADGVHAIFSVSTSIEGGTEVETRQGTTVADVAKSKGAYLVYTSVDSADKGTRIPHFESKFEVERHIRDIGVDAAIIAPVYFMENLIGMGRRALASGRYATPLSPDRKLAQIAVADIGAFAAFALENKARFVGKRIDIASDELSGAEAAAILSKVIGRPIEYFQTPKDTRSGDMATMFDWFERVGYCADPRALRAEYPEVGWHTFESWAKAQDWTAILG